MVLSPEVHRTIETALGEAVRRGYVSGTLPP
jgi:hypothetical protein